MDVLVLVDQQNLYKACKAKDIPLDSIFEEIAKKALQKGALQEIRLFVPNYQLITGPWRLINKLQLRYGLVVDVCPALREGAEMEESYKDVVDFEVLKWIMNYIHPGIGPDLIVFVTGDGHFIVAANEARRRGKEIEFWVVDPDTTSHVLLRNMPVETIEISESILIGAEENPFLSTLNKVTTEEELNEKDKERLDSIRKAGEILPSIETAVTVEAKLNAIAKELHGQLGIGEKDAQEILKALMTLGIARIYPIVTHGLSIDSSSILFQWLQAAGNSTLT